jgi:hypothetical protein
MPNNTNAQVVSFLGNSVRPTAEKIRGLKYEIDAIMVAWYGGMNTLTGNNSGNTIICIGNKI